MSPSDREALLAECLEDYHRRRALGEDPRAADYAERLGDAFGEFQEVLEAEATLDELIEPPEDAFPKPFGDYTLLAELGRGAMGVVYEAVHRPLGRKVALKVLRTGFDTEALALERFRREAQACAQVRHDHIVEIYEAGQVDGRPFYAMPILQGRSLAEVIRSTAAPDAKWLCRGLSGVADALHRLHEAGIVHRDVKPANIMVEPSGRMVLADFGLARTAMAKSLTQTGEALGTPLYMSPEQLLGSREEVDGRTDVYGLGVTLYEALARQPPFHADEVSRLMRMILAERPEPLSRLAPDVGRDCASIAMKAMERQREDRYPTAAAMRDDLLAFAEGRAVAGRPVSELRHRLRQMRRYLPAAAAAVLAAGGFLYWSATRPVTLTVVSYPVAEVFLGGDSQGPTPLKVPLRRGSYEVALRAEGFEERRRRVDLSDALVWETVLVARNPDDPRSVAALGGGMGMEMMSFEPLPIPTRGVGSGAPLEVLYPRGDVRVEDVTRWRIDIDLLFQPDGTVEFRRGGEVLHRVPFDPKKLRNEAEIPEPLRRALRPGDEVTWGYYPARGEPVTGVFRVVEPPPLPALATIEKRLEDQPRILAQFRAMELLKAGLPFAAFMEAERLVLERPDNAIALAVYHDALVRMGLGETGIAIEARAGISRLPAEQRDALFR